MRKCAYPRSVDLSPDLLVQHIECWQVVEFTVLLAETCPSSVLFMRTRRSVGHAFAVVAEHYLLSRIDLGKLNFWTMKDEHVTFPHMERECHQLTISRMTQEATVFHPTRHS